MRSSEAVRDGAGQFGRFLVVGIASTVVNYGVFYVLFQRLSLQYVVASSIGFVTGVLIGFQLNRAWTYRSDKAVSVSLTTRYGLVYLSSLMINIVLLNTLVSSLGISPIYADLLAICITTCTNFLGTKTLVFRK